MGVMELRRRIMLNEPHIVTPTSASVQNFKTDVIAPLKECKVHFSPVQEGTGDPSPSNVRPISGWTGVEVYRTGKNLLHDKHELPKAQISGDGSGGYQIKSANVYRVLSVEVPINTDLHIHKETIKGSDLALSTELAQIGIGVSRVGSMTNYYNRDFNTGNNPYVCLMIGNSVAVDDSETLWQLEIGSTATAYEPYSGTTLPIDWTTEVGTVYGGYVDLVKGEVVAEYVYMDMTEMNFNRYSAGTIVNMYSCFPGTIPQRNAMYCNILQPVSNPNVSKIEGIDWNNNRVNVCLNASRGIDSVSAFMAWLQAFKSNGQTPTLIAKVSEPIHHPIDPSTLKTLRGTNSIWSNANGNIDISYWTH